MNVVAALGGATDIGYVAMKSQADRLQASLTIDLQKGQRELESGKKVLEQANSNHDASLIDRAVADFDAAKADFQSAAEQADSSRFLRYVEYVPSVGEMARVRHAAVDGIAEMGVAVSDAAHSLSILDAEILKPSGSGEAGKTLLTVLDRVHSGLAGVRSDLDVAQKAAAKVDVSVVPVGQRASFVKAQASIDSALAGFAEFERLYPILIDVLGGNGLRRYLIEQVNPAELRAGGGFIGTYSVLEIDHGSLQIVRSGDSYDLANPRPLPGQPGFIPQPGPFREIVPQISWSFVDTNDFPDFPSSAQAAERFAQPHVGNLDGVFSIDYYAVAKMFDLTGPMAIPDYGITVDAGNFIDQVVHLELVRNAAHKAILSALAGPLMGRVAALKPDKWTALIGDLNGLADGRHIQLYFNSPSAEAEMDRIGWSGGLNPQGAGDFMMTVESNYKGGKDDYFLTRHYKLILTRVGDGVLHHKLIIDYTNNTPAWVRDFLSYIATLRLYVNSDATGATNDLGPLKYPYPGPAPGAKLFAGWLPVVNCCGSSAEVTLEYDTAWPAASKTHELYWQKQSGTNADTVSITWNDGRDPAYSTSTNLSSDRRITLQAGGLRVTDPAQDRAALPILTLG